MDNLVKSKRKLTTLTIKKSDFQNSLLNELVKYIEELPNKYAKNL